MSERRYQRGQDRRGNGKRRHLEFLVVKDQVKRRKALFIARLQRQLRTINGCIVAIGTCSENGYPRMNFRYKGELVTIHVMRVIAILRNCGPIPLGFEVAHEDDCPSRTCVLHTRLLHFSENANTYHKRRREDNEVQPV
jgi:hypothetical protein